MTGAPGRAARILAALCAGAGGLLVETATVRRQALDVGSDAEASALVVALFLLGLGLGGLLVARSRLLRASPRAAAALCYGAVAVAALAGDALVCRLAPATGPVGEALALLALPCVPAVWMGLAFPLLFAGLAGQAAGTVRALVALNLLGSVGAAWAGPNLLIPLLGITTTMALGAGCYVVAALLVTSSDLGATALAPTHRPAGLGGYGRAAFVAGMVVVGGQVLLLRRLPFFLDGFQPTLAGVLVACLSGLTLGAAFGPAWFRRFGAASAGVATLVGAAILCLGLHEHVSPALSRMTVASDAGMHLRVLLAAGVAAWPAMFALGAVVPLAIAAFPSDVRDAAAGELFLWQGLGGLVGALGVGQLLPLLAPEAFFVVAPVALAVAAAVSLGHAAPLLPRAGVAVFAVLAGALGLAGPGTLLAPAAPIRGSRWDRPLAYRPVAHRTDAVTTASVVYDRSAHSMVLFTDEFRAAYTGPGTSYMKVLGHLPFLLRDDVEDVAVIALGTGTTADAVCTWPSPRRVHVVEISRAVLALVDHFSGDGPVPTGEPAPFLADPRTEVHVTDGRRWLVEQPPKSLDVVTMEPLLPYAPGTASLYSAEFYALARSRLRDQGLFVQWVPTHAMPEATFDTLLATFADAFEFTSVWLVDQSTLLVGSLRPHLDDLDAIADRLAAAPAAAATTLHEAGITGRDDLLAAYLVDGRALREALASAPRLVDDRPRVEHIGYWSGEERLSFLPDNLRRLAEFVRGDRDAALGGADWADRRLLRLTGLAARAESILDVSGGRAGAAVAAANALRGAVPRSVLLHGEETLALRGLIESEVARRGPAGTAPLARRHVERDPGAALLQAIAGADRPPSEGAAAVARAVALDPTIVPRLPDALAALAPPPDRRRSPLDDVARLPHGGELADLGSRPDLRGLAVRAAFPVRVAEALLGVATTRALDAGERAAFVEVADPTTLAALAAACEARGGNVVTEVGPVWRRDLPVPPALARVARSGDAPARVALAAALGGRRGLAEREVLAELMVDPEPSVRTAAAAALVLTVGDAVSYDPDAPVSAREDAARALRALHNRRP